jgi:hypothetical protein
MTDRTLELPQGMLVEPAVADQPLRDHARGSMDCLIQRRTVITAAAAAWLAGCDQGNQSSATPTYKLQDLAGTNVDTSSEYVRNWPGEAALFKLREGLTLAIPPIYQEFWLQGDRVIRRPAAVSRAPTVPLIGFDFFMPDFGGYTPGNYRQPFHEDRVRVNYLSTVEPRTDGEAPLYSDIDGAISRLAGVFLLPDQFTDEHGLRCFASPAPSNQRRICVGERLQGERMLLDIKVLPYDLATTYPMVHARYYTKLYGGMEVDWSAHMKWFARWFEIEQQIWRFVDAWNVAK